MARDANFRFNPFTEQFEYEPITDESQTVSLIDEIGIFGFVLDEFPKIETSGDSLQIFEDVPGGLQWTEIDSSLDPNPGEYRLDKVHETGIVEMNAADDGRDFLVTYSGKGSIVNLKKIKSDTVQTEFFVNGAGIAGFMDDGRPVARRMTSGSMPGSTRFGTVPHGLPTAIYSQNENGYVGATSYIGQSSFTEVSPDGRFYYSAFVVRPTDCYILIQSGKEANWQLYISLDYFL